MVDTHTGYLLVVDDNKVNRLLLGRSLEQQGHRVEMAENGGKHTQKETTEKAGNT